MIRSQSQPAISDQEPEAQTWKTGLATSDSVFGAGSDIFGGEWGDDFDGNKERIYLISNESNGRLNSVGKEGCERKSLACVTLEAKTGGRSARKIGLIFEEAKICPASQEAKPSEYSSSVGAKNDTADGIKQQENSREMLDPHFDDSLQNRDSMLGDKLFECDEERSLKCNTATNLCKTANDRVVSRHCAKSCTFIIGREPGSVPSNTATSHSTPKDIYHNHQSIRDESNSQDEFSKFLRTPCSFEVFPAVEHRCSVDQNCEDVLLDKGRGEDSPWIIIEHRGNKREIWNDRSALRSCGRRAVIELSPSCDVIQKGERQLTDQQGARCGREIYPDRHDEKTV
ncbi:hypothetical protein EIK77_002825 [Talaromyces pinophilus]|nr:hypothetical protein EIK77_002825 [Talaromyces pinophilus]